MKYFTNAISHTWKSIKHNLLGLPPTHTVVPTDHGKKPSKKSRKFTTADIMTDNIPMPEAANIAPQITDTPDVPTDHGKKTSKKSRKLTKAASIAPQKITDTLDVPTDHGKKTSKKPRKLTTVNTLANNIPIPKAANIAPQKITGTPDSVIAPLESSLNIVELFGETNPSKAANALRIINKQQAGSIVLSSEGKDLYNLRGRQVPKHRWVTQQGYHYLTTQEAIAEMDAADEPSVDKKQPKLK